MSLGARSNAPVRNAVDAILNEFSKYDKEKQQWFEEKNALLLQMTRLKSDFHELRKEHEILLKRHKLLTLSLERPFIDQHFKQKKDQISNSKRKPFIDRLPASRYIRNRASTLSSTLPLKLDALFNKNDKKSWLSMMKKSPHRSPVGKNKEIEPKASKKKKKYPPLKPMSDIKSNGNGRKTPNIKDIIADDRRPKFTGKNAKFNVKRVADKSLPKAPSKKLPNAVNGNAKNGTATDDKNEHILLADRESVSEEAEKNFKLKLSPTLMLKNHLSSVRCLCITDDENTLISGSDDGMLKIWDLHRISNYMNTVNSQQYQQQQQKQPRRRTLRMPCPITYRGHSSAIIACKVIPNSNIVVSAGADNAVYGWKLPSSSNILLDLESLDSVVQFNMDEHSDVVWDIECNLKQWNVISSVSSDNTMKIFNIENQKIICDFAFHDTFVSPTTLLSIAEHGLLCIGNVFGNIALFDIKSNTVVKEMIVNDKFCINKIVYGFETFEKESLYVACDDSNVRVYNLKMMKCMDTHKVHTDSVTSLAINQKSNSMLTVSHDSQLRIWNYNDSKFSCIQHLEPQNTHSQKWNEGILDILVVDNYKWAFSAGADGSIRLYRTNL